MRSKFYRVVAVTCIVAVFAATGAFAAGPSLEQLRHEAFLRGGAALAAALNAKSEAEPLLPKALEEPMPPSKPIPAPQQAETSKGMNKFLLGGLIAGFAVSGFLIYHYATSPGASVRNCSTCK